MKAIAAVAAGEKETTTSVRCRLYQLFALAFTYPDRQWVEAIRAGEFACSLEELLTALDRKLLQGLDRGALCDAGDCEDALAAEYTRLFDINSEGGPLSLYGGHHRGGRTHTMEEVLRFYKHFGLQLDESVHELPDHIVCELEFLHFMTFQEAKILAEGGDASHYRRGQRDFVARQLMTWIPGLSEQLGGRKALPFFAELLRLLVCFLQLEQARLV